MENSICGMSKIDADLEEALVNGISKSTQEIFCKQIRDGSLDYSEILNVIIRGEDKKSWFAAWILCGLKHILFTDEDYEALIDYTLHCGSESIVRMTISLLAKSHKAGYFRSDLLDFCLDKMMNPKVSVGVRSVCVKLAYELCKVDSDLMNEFKMLLQYMDENEMSPAVSCARKNILMKH